MDTKKTIPTLRPTVAFEEAHQPDGRQAAIGLHDWLLVVGLMLQVRSGVPSKFARKSDEGRVGGCILATQ
jgi:hypothetical protein